MRSIDSKTLAVVLSLIGWAAVVPTSNAQTEVPLVLLTNAWHYNAGKTNPPANWMTNTFVASSWPRGLAAIGHEDVVMPAPIQTDTEAPNRNGPYTIYIRTNFNYPANLGTNGVTLIFTNLIDDGAIFYLNGREIQRIGMAAGAVTYGTFANRTVGDATAYEVFTIPTFGSPIRLGDNVLAVEVHNVNATSSDTVIATSLTARRPIQIVITDQPDSVTTAVGTPVTLTVVVTGSDPVYRWYKRPFPNVQGSGSSFTLNNPLLSSAGDYYVSISNVLGVVTSAVATVTVIPDRFPPGLVSAVAQELAPTNIFVTFTENLLTRTATNPACYRIELVGTTNIIGISNVVAIQNTVTLTVGGPNWHTGSNYILTVTGVSDTRGNYLNGLTNRIAVSFIRDVFSMGGPSLHFDWIDALLLDPTNLTAGNFFNTWMLPNSIDTNRYYWVPCVGVSFDDNNVPASICGTIGTRLGDLADDPGWPRAYYFRTRFVLPPNTGRGGIRLTASLDDGAVFYLNGVEIYRYNMPNGKVDWSTSAVLDVDPLNCVLSGLIDVTNLVSGTNLLATEVHNTSDASTLDYYFGVQIDAVVAPDAAPALQIKRTNSVPPGVLVTWTPTNFPRWVLLGRTNGTTTNWTQLTTNSPFQLPVTNNTMREFRLAPGP